MSFGWFDMKCSLHGLRIIYDWGCQIEREFCSSLDETGKVRGLCDG